MELQTTVALLLLLWSLGLNGALQLRWGDCAGASSSVYEAWSTLVPMYAFAVATFARVRSHGLFFEMVLRRFTWLVALFVLVRVAAILLVAIWRPVDECAQVGRREVTVFALLGGDDYLLIPSAVETACAIVWQMYTPATDRYRSWSLTAALLLIVRNAWVCPTSMLHVFLAVIGTATLAVLYHWGVVLAIMMLASPVELFGTPLLRAVSWMDNIIDSTKKVEDHLYFNHPIMPGEAAP